MRIDPETGATAEEAAEQLGITVEKLEALKDGKYMKMQSGGIEYVPIRTFFSINSLTIGAVSVDTSPGVFHSNYWLSYNGSQNKYYFNEV